MHSCNVQVVDPFSDRQGIPKVTSNRLAVLADGSWLLPVWHEGWQPQCGQQLPHNGAPGVLLSVDQACLLTGYILSHLHLSWLCIVTGHLEGGGRGGGEDLWEKAIEGERVQPRMYPCTSLMSSIHAPSPIAGPGCFIHDLFITLRRAVTRCRLGTTRNIIDYTKFCRSTSSLLVCRANHSSPFCCRDPILLG